MVSGSTRYITAYSFAEVIRIQIGSDAFGMCSVSVPLILCVHLCPFLASSIEALSALEGLYGRTDRSSFGIGHT